MKLEKDMANYKSLKNWIGENITLQFIFVNVTVATLKKLISIIFILATLNRVVVLKIESKI